ncbi:MAG: ferric reductase-like transmembrane domain-containing protein [Chloroflexota bacterium]
MRANAQRITADRYLWVILYFIVLLAPLVVVLVGPRPGPRQFWRELSVGLGFVGLALMGVQFVPTARLRAISNVFAMDEIYRYHKLAAVFGFLFVLAHPLILFLFNPTTVHLLNPFTAPTRAIMGLVSLLAASGLVITSIFRQPLGIRYEVWRWIHIILALTVVITAMLHILGVNYYLSMPGQRILWVGLTGLWVVMILNNRAVKPAAMLRKPYKVTDIQSERDQTWTLTLQPDGHDGMRFMPGQFVWLTVGGTPFNPNAHPFSIASSADKPREIKLTIDEVGDFTSRISEVPIGETVYLDGPHGSFSFDIHDAPGYVFLAGGIGSPPIMSMLRTMADRDIQKPAWLVYGNPDLESVTYRDELESLQQKLNLTVIYVLEQPPERWQGETGFITADILDRHLPENRDEMNYFICGPIPMIDVVTQALDDIGISKQRVFTEEYEMV